MGAAVAVVEDGLPKTGHVGYINATTGGYWRVVVCIRFWQRCFSVRAGRMTV